MSRLYMLDTNTVSYILKGMSPAARAALSRLAPGDIACISAITEGELRFGLDRVGAGIARRNALEALLTRMEILPWGRKEASTYGAFRSRQEEIGRPLGPFDTLIAAHAIAAGATLVSNDTDFGYAEGLPGLEAWATELPTRPRGN